MSIKKKLIDGILLITIFMKTCSQTRIMRVIALLTFILSVSFAYAITPEEVCNGLYTDSTKNKCLTKIANRTFQSEALQVCNGLYTDSTKIKCLAKIANRTFQSEALQLCNGLYTDSTKNKCLTKISNRTFKNDVLRVCENLYTDSEKIKCLQSQETNQEKITHTKSDTKQSERLSGRFKLIKSVDRCGLGYNEYGLKDEVTPSFKANKPVNTTKLYTWISYCDNSNHETCYTPYIKHEKDILPDWDGIRNSSPQKIYKILSNNGKKSIPDYGWYNFAIIIKDNVVAEKMIKVNHTCR